MLAESPARCRSARTTKGKQRLQITDPEGVAHEYLIPKDKHMLVHEGQVVNKGELIVDGPADPHDILRLQGRRGAGALHRRRGAGRLSPAGREDQRQAHRGDRAPDAAPREITDPPATPSFILGEQVERSELLDANDKASAGREGKKPAGGHRRAARHHQGVAVRPTRSSRRRRSRRPRACSPRRRSWASATSCAA
jgi:DNA-directed RNA polymerase subunit beta'